MGRIGIRVAIAGPLNQPRGLGKPWDEIRPYLEAAAGKRALQLATVAPAQHVAGPGRG